MEVYNNDSDLGLEGLAGLLWTLGCLLMVASPVFTGSGVASAKQTGHCGLNDCVVSLPPSAPSSLLRVCFYSCLLDWRCRVFDGCFLSRLTCSVYPRTPQQGILAAVAYPQAVMRLEFVTSHLCLCAACCFLLPSELLNHSNRGFLSVRSVMVSAS